ncbi:MAG: hypothetical protein AAF843_08685, partial [Bacteroidota bacterium]
KANISSKVNSPCFALRVNYTMTKFLKQVEYEKAGIPPDYQLDYSHDWIDQTLKILSRVN